MNIIKTRPAETAGIAGGVGAVIVALAAGNTLAGVLAAVTLIPAAVTYLNTHGGLRGILGGLWKGRSA